MENVKSKLATFYLQEVLLRLRLRRHRILVAAPSSSVEVLNSETEL